MLINLIIADTNHEYMKRLSEYIEDKYKGAYEIELIDGKDKLYKRVEKTRCGILLMTSNVYDPDINFRNVDLAVLLMDEESQESDKEKFKRKINKYTRITKLMEYLEYEYEEMEKNRPLIYTVYSPAGGVGKTTIALSTALAYAKIGRQVLYINLEDIDSTPMYFDEQNQSLDEQLTEVLQTSPRTLLLNRVVKDKFTGIRYLRRDEDILDTSSLRADEIVHTIQSAMDSELVNIVIVDTNSNINLLNKTLFEESNYILMVVNEKKESTYKLNSLIASRYIDTDLQEKVRLVTNFGARYNINNRIQNVGSINKIENNNALDLCRYIAKSNLLNLHGLNAN